MKRFYTMNWLTGLACLALTFGSVACSNGGGGGGSAANTNLGVVGSITSPANIYNSIQSSSYFGDSQFAMTLYGQSGTTTSGNGFNPAVALSGTLNLIQGNISFCNAPAGSYTITTIQTAQMSGTSIGPFQMQATGPATIMMSVSYGIVENAGSRISLNMNVYVNGQPCGQLITL